MTKAEFLMQLQAGLSALSQEDKQERLAFYHEMIDDRMEEGLSEEEAVAEVGPVQTVIAQILSDTPYSAPEKEEPRSQQEHRGWQIALIILGSPLWLSLLLTGLALLISLFAVLFSLIVTLWSVFFAIGVSGIGCAIAAVIFALTGFMNTAMAVLGIGTALIGCSILLFLLSKSATDGLIHMGKATVHGIRNRLSKKEETHA